jgi:uncharacterized cupredoxin-like copper-binding protein
MHRKQTALVLLVAATAFAGCGGSGAPADTSADVAPTDAPKGDVSAQAGAIEVGLREWAVQPATAQIDSGSVEFNAVNDGDVPHELVVLKTDTPAADLPQKGDEAEEDGEVAGEAGDIAPGESKPLNVDLEPGHYVLLCNLPGHYADGMHADFVAK